MSFTTIIVCDHKWRDLPGLVWLKLLLEQEHPRWHVMVLPKQECFTYTRLFGAGLVVLPSSNGKYLENAAKLRELGAASIILPTEGRPTFGKSIDYSVKSYDGNMADGVLHWSHVMADAWQACESRNAMHASVVGATRFDFYRPPLSGQLSTADQFLHWIGAESAMPIVSWATAFPYAKFFGCNQEWQVRDWMNNNYTVQLGLEREHMLDMIRNEHDNRAASWHCLRHCAALLPGVCFCVKPHPYEDFDWCDATVREWREKGIDNVFLIQGVYIWDLLSACTVHVSRACTTTAEAWMLRKPTIELGFIGTHEQHLEVGDSKVGSSKDAEPLKDVALSPESVVEKLRHYLDVRSVPEELQSARDANNERWCFKVDGCSTRRAVEQISGWVSEWRPHRKRFFSWGGLGRRLKVRTKELVGFPFDEWIRQPGRPIESEYDKVGHWDRVICQRDVLAWERKLRPYLRSL